MTLAERAAGAAQASFTLPVAALDLQATIDGGQAFRWWEVSGSNGTAFDGVIGSTAVRISQASTPASDTAVNANDQAVNESGAVAVFPPPPRRGRDGERVSQPEAGRLLVEQQAGSVQITVRGGNPGPEFPDQVAAYLGLNTDLEPLRLEFADDACIGPAVAGFAGLRLLRQDPWECLASFICSSTSNIPRIKLNIGSVARELGTRVGPGPADFEFPSPAAVAAAGEQTLRDLGLGFRAKYLAPAAEKVASGQLDLFALRKASYSAARAALIALDGVGEKIADCVLAFSLDKPEAFPVDRHIKRALERWYGLPEGMNNSKTADWARARFGNHGAIAQQYMFHRERLARRASSWGGRHIAVALPEDRELP